MPSGDHAGLPVIIARCRHCLYGTTTQSRSLGCGGIRRYSISWAGRGILSSQPQNTRCTYPEKTLTTRPAAPFWHDNYQDSWIYGQKIFSRIPVTYPKTLPNPSTTSTQCKLRAVRRVQEFAKPRRQFNLQLPIAALIATALAASVHAIGCGGRSAGDTCSCMSRPYRYATRII